MTYPDYGSEKRAERSPIWDQAERIPNLPNSITAADGGVRMDPEASAPERKVNRITWKNSRNADRTMTLGAYL